MSGWGRTVALAAAAALLATACSGGDGGGERTSCRPTGTTIRVTAEDISFDETCLAAPTRQPFSIEFTNDDEGIPHNVAIYTDESAATPLFVGEIFPGPETRTYQVPALDPGTYFFRCDVHPTQMTGTFVVR